MHCHTSLYSKATTENSNNKINITNNSLYFHLKQQHVEDNIKAGLIFKYFLDNNSYFVCFDMYD